MLLGITGGDTKKKQSNVAYNQFLAARLFFI